MIFGPFIRTKKKKKNGTFRPLLKRPEIIIIVWSKNSPKPPSPSSQARFLTLVVLFDTKETPRDDERRVRKTATHLALLLGTWRRIVEKKRRPHTQGLEERPEHRDHHPGRRPEDAASSLGPKSTLRKSKRLEIQNRVSLVGSEEKGARDLAARARKSVDPPLNTGLLRCEGEERGRRSLRARAQVRRKDYVTPPAIERFESSRVRDGEILFEEKEEENALDENNGKKRRGRGDRSVGDVFRIGR